MTKNNPTWTPYTTYVCPHRHEEPQDKWVSSDPDDHSISADGNAYWDDALQDWDGEVSDSGNDWCSECGEVNAEDEPLSIDEIASALEYRVKSNQVRVRACAVCGQHEHHLLLDEGKCVKCYGPGWAPADAHAAGRSIRPDLLPLYLDWIRGQMVKAKIAEATSAPAA